MIQRKMLPPSSGWKNNPIAGNQYETGSEQSFAYHRFSVWFPHSN
jgi:hypothetical protein